jgi:hypothetical protein
LKLEPILKSFHLTLGEKDGTISRFLVHAVSMAECDVDADRYSHWSGGRDFARHRRQSSDGFDDPFNFQDGYY